MGTKYSSRLPFRYKGRGTPNGLEISRLAVTGRCSPTRSMSGKAAMPMLIMA
ncbi:hypothetical protein D3C85_1850780 [compost metagenome]